MVNQTGTWDLPSLNYRNPNMGLSSNNSSVYNNSSMLNTPMGRVYTSPPPVPARPNRPNIRNRTAFSNGYNSYSSLFNNYGGYYPSYGNYGGYGSYGFGSFRPDFNSYGCYGNSYPESRFIQMAERSSRPAFQSIQSILQAFSSVTMMFESSFHAIYSSYMSVLGVADNLGKLRTVFGEIFSTFALIRSLGWLYRKVLHMLGVNKYDSSKEMIWSEAMNGISDVNSDGSTNRKRRWPTILFLSIIIGGPYLLFKLMSELYPEVVPAWNPAKDPGSLAVGLYDFHAASEQELSFTAQQKLMIAPNEFQPLDCPGWLLACNENQRTGLVPNNYIGMVMQSEKTGQTFIEHNGQTYQNPIKSKENSMNETPVSDITSEISTKVNDSKEINEEL